MMKSARHRYGVFASNKLPKYISRSCIVVVNTDPDYLPGTHWTALYITEGRIGYFFDSFGRYPQKEILHFLLKNTKLWFYNTKVIQDVSSSVCGKYCLLFLLNFVLNNSTCSFLNVFSKNYKKNDLICEQLFDFYFEM